MLHHILAPRDHHRTAVAPLTPRFLLVPLFVALTLVILIMLLGIFVLWLCAVGGLFASIFISDMMNQWFGRWSRPPLGALDHRPLGIPGR